MVRRKLYSIVLFLFACSLCAQERVVYTINDNWRFCKGKLPEALSVDYDDSLWERVNIPHTWNDRDADDEIPGFYRGAAWYRRSVFIDKSKEGNRTIIYFEGANQAVKLYLNGHFVGEHKGGYTRFCFDVTTALNYGEDNLFVIRVDNSHNPDIPPLSADFTFFGGIYRDVYLKFINPVHIATNDYASSGVYISTPEVSESVAWVDVTALVTNGTKSVAEVILENVICDAGGNEVTRTSAKLSLKAAETKTHCSHRIKIDSPHLWDITDPYLYTVHTRVFDKKKRLLDEVVNPLGLRWFRFDSEQGFFLNGRQCKLVGTARHQDYFRKGTALRDEQHVQDVLLLKEMGGNFLRVSHYPQDPTIMEMCDKLGIITSVEIPLVNSISETDTFLNNSINMAKEMIRQDFNHPSVMIWGYMNEIFLRLPDMEKGSEQYFLSTRRVAQALEEVIRSEDPFRYTMIAFHNAPLLYEKAGLTEIPMILGWNLYQGWYEPDINVFQKLLDRAHDRYKGKILMVTEYGVGVDSRLHSYHPERFDYSQEYGLLYHTHCFNEIAKRPFVAGSALWNLNDFYSEPRTEIVPHINNKGILGLDREMKDCYLFYKASLSTTPVLLIGNREWKNRGGSVNTNKGESVQSVPVFSNATQVELIVNGKSIGTKKIKDSHALFDVPFRQGENLIEAVAELNGKTLRDIIRVRFHMLGEYLKDMEERFTEMNVMLGSPRYFEERTSGITWLPEQAYQPGSWGFVGGMPYRRKVNVGSLLGADIDIKGTDMNPLYQTQRVGIESFKADVPDGRYAVYLHWAELESAKQRAVSLYNLGNDAQQDISSKRRIFDVSINDTFVLKEFDIAHEYGEGYAVAKKFIINVRGGRGLSVDFHKREGEPILNAIRIYRIY